ncbi:MAG: tRNA uridine-5-carboxymethylaminomethyl(34) synthesis enzyme MnmG [Planctomycetota bacterium]
MTRDFDVLIVGGGHAGVEAATAAARTGARTAMVVLEPAAIGRMSCNPAIGGLAKGQLVREVDALGGEMGVVTDQTGIQFRMLNTSKGPAVRSPRAQCDRDGYNRVMAQRVLGYPGVTVLAGEVVDLVASQDGASVAGVVLQDGSEIAAPAVVLRTGTFLGGKLFAGRWEEAGGRHGERAASRISAALQSLGVQLGRHKTGTPPRLRRSTICFDGLEEQLGDDPPVPFSFRTERLDVEQMPCWLTRTNERTHEIIAAHADESPMFSGRIQGTGPRYCPSVEDKVVRFRDAASHPVFLEPEGRESDEVYPNGISTSLPPNVQMEFLRTIPGLENVELLRPGYAVEYDYILTTQIRGDLQVATLRGLFAAGQINGTSGYEEAAGQGLVAGLNAARFSRGEPPVVIDRATGYLGVMIDDLCRVNPEEPYRMFTSRAEFRLLLRSDNADRRLTPLAEEWGLVPAERADAVRAKEQRIRGAVKWLEATRRSDGKTFAEWLRRPEIVVDDVGRADEAFAGLQLSAVERAEVEAEIKYDGYIKRQAMEVERLQRLESRRIPERFDYGRVSGLSNEAQARLEQRRPLTLGEASRVAGVRQADVQLLLVVLER